MTQINKNKNSDGKQSGSGLQWTQQKRFFENKIAREQEASLLSVRWLTTEEAAQYLRVSISSIKAMIYRGQIRPHKLGRRNRFLRDELDRLLTLQTSRMEA